MRAKVQGEFHTSKADRELLLDQVNTDVDALFIEQREDTITPDRWTLGYIAFVTGAFLIYWLQAVLYDGPKIKEQVEVPVHDNIDTPLPSLYSRIPQKWRLLAGVSSAGIFAYGLFLVNWQFPFITLPNSATTVLTLGIKPFVVLGAVLVYSFTMIFVEERKIGHRDQNMAQAITEISEEEGYENVVVSCGEAHLDRLPELLKENGWEVSINQSEHSTAAKFWRQ